MNPTLRRWLRRGAVLGGLILVIVLLRLTVFRPEPVHVSVYRADRGTVEATVVNSRSGTVHSRHEAELSPAVSGRVTGILARKGAQVTAGQLLLELDSSVERAQVDLSREAKEAADAAAQEACLNADQRKRDLDRAQKLAQDGLVSTSRLEEAKTAYESARSVCQGTRKKADQAEASLEMARAMLNKMSVKAPFSGVLARIDAEVGEWIAPAAPGLPIPSVISLVDLDHLYVSAPLDEVDVGRVSVGQPARVTMDALPNRDFSGQVTWKSPRVDTQEEQNRTLEVEVEFAEGQDLSQVVPGASADIEIILESRDDVLRVPSYAVLAGDKVLVLRDGTLREASVSTGLQNWEYAEITSGLEVGDAVVVTLDRAEIKAGARAVADTLEAP